MLFNMKPTCKQLDSLRVEIANAKNLRGLSYAEIARKTSVDPSQVTRICHGQFKTFSRHPGRRLRRPSRERRRAWLKAPRIVLDHHLKSLKLSTFMREHTKQASIAAKMGLEVLSN